MSKLVAIIQARFSSTRLPGKVLAPFCDMEMLRFQIGRLKRVQGLDAVWVATSTLAVDDAVAACSEAAGASVFRGSEQDVLGRYAGAADAAGAVAPSDRILRVSGDNPLIDPETVEAISVMLNGSNIDHVNVFQEPSYPYGAGASGFTRAALDIALRSARDAHDREHVEPAMLRDDCVRTVLPEAPVRLRRPEISLTVDEPVDLERVRRAAERLVARFGPGFALPDIIDYFDDTTIVCVANAQLGLDCVRHLAERNEKIIGLVTHPIETASLRDEIIAAAGLSGDDILSPKTLRAPYSAAWLRERQPEIITSFWSRFIFPANIIDQTPRGVTNLHNSLLPLARGGEANIWTILEDHTAGVTFHYITEQIDAGPVIAARETPLHSWDTGKTLFERLHQDLVHVFIDNWPRVRVGPIAGSPQVGDGTYHGRRAADPLRVIDLDAPTTARQFLNLLRAFTFEPYPGMRFVDEKGRAIDVTVTLKPESVDDGQ